MNLSTKADSYASRTTWQSIVYTSHERLGLYYSTYIVFAVGLAASQPLLYVAHSMQLSL